MIQAASILALTLSSPTAAPPPACFDSVVLGSVDRVDDIAPLRGSALGGATAEWTIRVSRHELGEETPAMVVATGQAEPVPAPRSILRIFLQKDGPQHYVAVFWVTFATPRPRLPPGLRVCPRG
jgi:hypothetical protein